MRTNLNFSILIVLATTFAMSQQQEATLTFTPDHTSITFTLGATLHTVHGTFRLASGRIQFVPATNAIGGEIVVDATSGNSGSTGRDRKMHKEILESTRYPELRFRPDRVDGKVLPTGVSNVQVHGLFGIRGGEHEITIPAQVDLEPGHWSMTARFDIPYVAWGLRDPSTFILRVEKVVRIDMQASGADPWHAQP